MCKNLQIMCANIMSLSRPWPICF